MPELPEAEISRRSLAPLVMGRRIERALVTLPNRIRQPARDPGAFAGALEGRVLVAAERRGKSLLLLLDDGNALAFSFGLWASVTVRSGFWRGAEPPRKQDLAASDRGLALELGAPPRGRAAASPLAKRAPCGRGPAPAQPEAGPEFLVFADLLFATYGVERYVPPPPPPPFDALDPELTAGQLAKLGAVRKQSLKALLTDERFMLGIGNGYSDEILWAARLSPAQPTFSLAAHDWQALRSAVSDVLEAGIAAGGERGFLDARGNEGTCDRPIHHHGGEPCPRCGTTLASTMKGKRETNFCPACQSLST